MFVLGHIVILIVLILDVFEVFSPVALQVLSDHLSGHGAALLDAVRLFDLGFLVGLHGCLDLRFIDSEESMHLGRSHYLQRA